MSYVRIVPEKLMCQICSQECERRCGMSGKICGYCTNWRCDEPLHLKGHCIINRMDRFHGTMCDTCTKFQSMWEYTRPATEEEKGGAE